MVHRACGCGTVLWASTPLHEPTETMGRLPHYKVAKQSGLLAPSSPRSDTVLHDTPQYSGETSLTSDKIHSPPHLPVQRFIISIFHCSNATFRPQRATYTLYQVETKHGLHPPVAVTRIFSMLLMTMTIVHLSNSPHPPSRNHAHAPLHSSCSSYGHTVASHHLFPLT